MCFYRKEMCPKRLATFAKSHQWEVFKCIKYNFQRVCCTLYSKIHRLYSNFIPTHQALALCSNVVLVPPHVAFAVEPWQVNALMVGSRNESPGFRHGAEARRCSRLRLTLRRCSCSHVLQSIKDISMFCLHLVIQNEFEHVSKDLQR